MAGSVPTNICSSGAKLLECHAAEFGTTSPWQTERSLPAVPVWAEAGVASAADGAGTRDAIMKSC